MAKSGAKVLGAGLLLFAVGVVAGYLADSYHGNVGDWLIRACVALCIGGAATAFYGLFKVAAGLVKRA